MSASDTAAELVEVRLRGLPPQLAQSAREHFAELSREFLHLANADEEVRRDVPGRLLALSDALRARFSQFADQNQVLIDEAAERGEPALDLTYLIPPEAGPAVAELAVLLDEADRYCERGDYLLTLKTPAEALAYRRWYLRQFIDQIDGAAPVAFQDWTRSQ